MKPLMFFTILFFASVSLFAQSTNPSPYCSASFDDQEGFWVDDHINSVSFGALSNVSNSQYAAPHYVFYNNLSVANFTRGNTYTLSVNFYTAGGCGYGVWIDFNHNNTFEESEQVAGTTGSNFLTPGATPTITQSVTIPSTATLGNTRMRIRIVEDDMHNSITTSQLPCNASTSAMDVMDWGETEDYTINITGTTGVHEVEPTPDVALFPNPSTGIFTLTTDNDNAKDIEVYSLLGSLMYKQTVNGLLTKLDLTQLLKGVYFVRMTTSNKVLYVRRIVIE